MTTREIVHDLTIALIINTKSCSTPEEIVTAYSELLPKVNNAYKTILGKSTGGLKVLSDEN